MPTWGWFMIDGQWKWKEPNFFQRWWDKFLTLAKRLSNRRG